MKFIVFSDQSKPPEEHFKDFNKEMIFLSMNKVPQHYKQKVTAAVYDLPRHHLLGHFETILSISLSLSNPVCESL